MTYEATLRNMTHDGVLVRYVPRLRHDQQPQRYAYVCSTALAAIHALEEHPNGERPDPYPREQILVLLDDFCAGEALVENRDFERRGKGLCKGLYIWKTRSVRIAGLYVRSTHFIAVQVIARAMLTGHSADWYSSARDHTAFKRLHPYHLWMPDPHVPEET